MPDNRNNKGYYRPEQNRRPQGQNRPQQQEGSTWLTPTVKGIIAILLTVLVVAIVIMIFAKTLFVNTNTTPKKTGTITSTEYIPPKSHRKHLKSPKRPLSLTKIHMTVIKMTTVTLLVISSA